MASKGKKRTTFAKLNREQKVRERRIEKQARKDARKRAAANDQPVVAPAAPDGTVL
jgi:hypothetical protein